MMLSNPRGEFFIAFDGQKPCGQFMFCKSRDKDLTGYAEIVSIYTLEEYWGKDVGKAMMEKALKEISNNGYEKVCLWVLKNNGRARRFYEKFGFFFDGTEKKSLFSSEIIEVRYILAI